MSVSDLIRNVRKLNPSELEAFLKQLRELENQSAEKDLSEKEVELLKQINKPFTRKKNLRLNYLIARRDAETLTETEYEELLKLYEDFEKFELKRLKSLTKLADFRKQTLPEIVEFFNIKPLPAA